jgi:hypothetical protein
LTYNIIQIYIEIYNYLWEQMEVKLELIIIWKSKFYIYFSKIKKKPNVFSKYYKDMIQLIHLIQYLNSIMDLIIVTQQ